MTTDTLCEIFLHTVSRYGNQLAVDIPPTRERPDRIQLTYAALADRVADLVVCLLHKDGAEQGNSGCGEQHNELVDEESGAGPSEDTPHMEVEALVGLCLPRGGPDLIAAQLAASFLGRPWTYLDPSWPAARSRLVVEDGNVKTVIAEKCTAEYAMDLGIPVIVTKTNTFKMTSTRVWPTMPLPPPQARPNTAAYIIYTSGSTGRPKGVVIEHHSIVNYVTFLMEHFGLKPGDRIAQSSSAAYDAYVEELWLALAVGATAVVLDDQTIRLGPDLPEFLRQERVTVLQCPPTLLRTMGCADPQVELPGLRLIYVGGEALPPDIAAAWAPGRQLENGYGPTECSVAVLRATIRADGPISIGYPVPGNDAHVLDENLEPVPVGSVGELCISGAQVARGYLGRPDLTAKFFPIHPRFGRLYRTGDLVRVDDVGQHYYLGRADLQVKIRGYRIELEEIEAQLVTYPGVKEAACAAIGDTLAAWIVGGHELNLDGLAKAIEAELPSQMCPTQYYQIDELPRSTGMKIDRKALQPKAVTKINVPSSFSKDTNIALVQKAFSAALNLDSLPGENENFFIDLGGHSVAAAIAVSSLRADPRGQCLAMRDIYEAPTVHALAARLNKKHNNEILPHENRVQPKEGCATFVTTCQLATLTLTGYLWSIVISLVLVEVVPIMLTPDNPILRLLFGAAFSGSLVIVTFIGTVAIATTTKRSFIGQYKTGRHPAWGSFHLRHWLTRNAAERIPFELIRNTGIDRVVLRLLGARIGKNVHIDREVPLLHGGWDLMNIGDNAVLGRASQVTPVCLDSGALVTGPVCIGSGAVLETRSGMAPGSSLGCGSRLGSLSVVVEDSAVPDNTLAVGIPSHRKLTNIESLEEDCHGLSPLSYGVLLLAARITVLLVLLIPSFAYGCHLAVSLGVNTAHGDLLAIFHEPSQMGRFILMVITLVFVDLVLRAGLCRLIGTPQGVHSRCSLAVIQHDISTGLLEGAGNILSATLFWPIWLRMAGMKIGQGCEIDTIKDVTPGALKIGSGSFFADNIYLGGPRYGPHKVTFAPTTLGSGVFIGNHAVVPGGSCISDDVLVGVATVVPKRVNPGTSWFGLPAFQLPQREIIEVDRSLTHDPSLIRWLNRFGWEAARFLIPVPPLLALEAAWGFILKIRDPWVRYAIISPLTFLSVAAALCLATIALKWFLLGRARPGTHPLWSCWVSRWDFLFVVWKIWATPIMEQFNGTLVLVPWLRAFGARIGRRPLLGDNLVQVSDPDMLVIGDHATVDGYFQAHSFEDRVLKTGPLRIRNGASTGFGSIMLYGADLGDHARLLPHSVVMKHETLDAEADHIGAPTIVNVFRSPGSLAGPRNLAAIGA